MAKELRADHPISELTFFSLRCRRYSKYIQRASGTKRTSTKRNETRKHEPARSSSLRSLRSGLTTAIEHSIVVLLACMKPSLTVKAIQIKLELSGFFCSDRAFKSTKKPSIRDCCLEMLGNVQEDPEQRITNGN